MRKIFILLMALSLLSTSCSNVLTAMANKETDEAHFETAQKSMDSQDWDTAITELEAMSETYKRRTDVIEMWAGVLAGKCGFDFITYFTNLGSASLSGSTIFKYFMNAFTGKSVSASYCALAQAKMEEIGSTPASRTSGQNLFMAILGMVKIGVYLRGLADVDGSNGLGDGSADATFDSCSTASLSDANLNQVITGLGLISANLTYLTAVLSSTTVTDSLSTVTSVCGASCGITDSSQVSAADRNMVRDLLKTGSTNPTAPLGIESCVDPLVTPCCP